MTDYVPVSCPKCSKGVSARREYVGRDVLCKYCGYIFKVAPVGDRASTGGGGSGSEQAPSGAADTDRGTPDDAEVVRFPCPKCSKRLKMRRELIGSKVTCRRCNHVFAIEPGADGVAPYG